MTTEFRPRSSRSGPRQLTPLDKIDNERYLTNLARKLVCISFDIQTDRKVFGEAFIRITGGDPVATRQLYKEVEGRVVPTVRFLGSMNPDMPRFIAAPDALERRLIFLMCSARVAVPDPDRFEKIKTERAGVLTRWVKALQRLYERGSFDIPQESLDEVADYAHEQDPFDLFVAERLALDVNAKTPVAEIAKAFNFWADTAGVARLDVNVVGRKLRRAGFQGSFHRVDTGAGEINCRVVNARVKSYGTEF